ncbi:MAG: esterase [Variovorax sp.]|nr:MAG: esterase [Variovorax sp.]
MNDAIVIQQPASPAEALVLLFHGVGATAADMVPLGRRLATARPGAMVVSVSAPHASDLGRGRQWFSVIGVTEDNRPARVRQALPAFAATVEHWQRVAGARPGNTAVVGFSQGAIMALEATQLTAVVAHCVVAIAGRFAQQPRVAPAVEAVHLVHGEQDAVIPVAHAMAAAGWLRALGALVTQDLLPGLGHGIDSRAAERVAERVAAAQSRLMLPRRTSSP